MLPELITTYLTEQGIPHDDLDASFRSIGLDGEDVLCIGMAIGDPHLMDMPEHTLERWQTLSDVVETVRAVDQREPWKVGV